MIRSVDVGVAVGAATVEILNGAERLGLGRMAAAVVAGVANARHAHFQELWIIAAVRFVAVGAVFEHRRVLPEERTPAFGMTTQAVFVGGRLDQLLGIRRAVGIVAAGAGDFAFAIGHVRRALQLPAAHLVALEAQFWLSHFYALIIRERLAIARVRRDADMHALLDLVAIHAGDAAGFVRAALPEQVRAARVAIHADGVLLGDGVGRILAETNGNAVFAPASFYVCAAWAMTGLAASRFLWCMRVEQHDLAHDGVLEALMLIVMASYAGIAANVVPVSCFGRGGLGLFLRGRALLIGGRRVCQVALVIRVSRFLTRGQLAKGNHSGKNK